LPQPTRRKKEGIVSLGLRQSQKTYPGACRQPVHPVRGAGTNLNELPNLLSYAPFACIFHEPDAQA